METKKQGGRTPRGNLCGRWHAGCNGKGEGGKVQRESIHTKFGPLAIDAPHPVCDKKLLLDLVRT
jgi:hypothetical protein